jgi:hypothetical protein
MLMVNSRSHERFLHLMHVIGQPRLQNSTAICSGQLTYSTQVGDPGEATAKDS